eukprot:9440265-Alexandrium_andersonii.AAC.1
MSVPFRSPSSLKVERYQRLRHAKHVHQHCDCCWIVGARLPRRRMLSTGCGHCSGACVGLGPDTEGVMGMPTTSPLITLAAGTPWAPFGASADPLAELGAGPRAPVNPRTVSLGRTALSLAMWYRPRRT